LLKKNLKGSTSLERGPKSSEYPFSKQWDDSMRLDLKLGCTLNSNKKKKSHKFYIDLQNSTNRDTIFLRKYNKITNSVGQINQAEFFPDFGHRFQF